MNNINKSTFNFWFYRVLLTFFILFTTISLNSCLNYYQEVKLYPDGSGKMHIDYWMKFVNEESKIVAENLGIFNADSIRSEFQSRYTKIENVVVYRDSTDSTTHALIDFSFNHIVETSFPGVPVRCNEINPGNEP